MENENLFPVYAFTKEHEFIGSAIYTIAGVCSPDALEEFENLTPDDSRIRWMKALWDTGLPTHPFLTGWH